jgi:hypothetical protein
MLTRPGLLVVNVFSSVYFESIIFTANLDLLLRVHIRILSVQKNRICGSVKEGVTK